MTRIVTEDEFGVYNYDPECKAQSMQYRHETSLSPRKFKVVASARKVLFTVFWGMEGVVHMSVWSKVRWVLQAHITNSRMVYSWVPILQVGGLRKVRVNCFPKATATWHGRESHPRPPDRESDALTTLPR
ncbi:transposase [Elysia marginata]|uniref:Transposase n=1 Tax=Elysia marginata TaxID=1093978 RepID=A0AAV4G1I3_9GAST|nr:transposase [Elysia marginata]